jgi:hypothetical protein
MPLVSILRHLLLTSYQARAAVATLQNVNVEREIIPCQNHLRGRPLGLEEALLLVGWCLVLDEINSESNARAVYNPVGFVAMSH